MRAAHRVLCVLFVVAATAAYLVAASPVGTRGGRYIALHFVLTALMLGVWALPRRGTDQRLTLGAGLLARLFLIGVPAFTSHDVVRYLWDGHAVLAGVDPYRVAPDVAWRLLGDWPWPADNTQYPTLYPPGALALFAASAAFGPSLAFWIWKVVVAVASCAALALVWWVMRERALQRHLPLVALSPLLLLEGGVGAHVDVVTSLAVVACVFFADRNRHGLLGASVGAAAVTKILPLALLAPASAGARRLTPAVVGLALVGATYGGALFLGLHPIGSLPGFFVEWRFGSLLFELASVGIGDAGARLLVPLVSVGGIALAAHRARTAGFVAGAQWALAVPLLASPVVFPWYLAAFVPLLALRPSAAGIAWVTALPLTYEVIDAFDAVGVWQPVSWPLWAIGGAWLFGLVVDHALRRRAGVGLDRPSVRHRVSVIVPTLDEEARIGRLLDELSTIWGLHETIVVDGASADRTLDIARSYPGVRTLEAPRGRASQMNRGATAATGDILLFLHADVLPPADLLAWIARALDDERVVAGAFRTWTVGNGKRSWLGPLLHLADVRSRYTSLPYGDQALFVRADAFRAVGGFPDLPLMEDLELSRRLRRLGLIRTVPATVRVSGRRFLARPVYYTVLVNLFPFLYRLGTPPRLLAALYGAPR